jgi:DNA-directed RNA polymerase subunit beta
MTKKNKKILKGCFQMTSISRSSLVKRKSFVQNAVSIDLPNLIEVQSRSFNDFIQLDMLPEDRKNIGLEKVFRDIFPITYGDLMSLEYVGYELGNWNCTCGLLSGIEQRYEFHCTGCGYSGRADLKEDYDCKQCGAVKSLEYKKCSECLMRVKIKPALTVDECRFESQSFSLPLKVKLQLVSWQNENGIRSIRDVKEQSIFFLDLPVMIDFYQENNKYLLGSNGTFVLNGVDRVIVSQIHRSAGVIFSLNKKSKEANAASYSAKIIPMRGSWIDFEIDSKDILYVRVDKTKKLLATTFLQALGISRDEISTLFYKFYSYIVKDNTILLHVDEFLLGMRIEQGMIPKHLEPEFLYKQITTDILNRLHACEVYTLSIKKTAIINKYIGVDIIDKTTGQLIAKKGEILTDALYKKISQFNDIVFLLVASSGYVLNPIIHLTLTADKCFSTENAIKELYHKMYPGDNASLAEMQDKINMMFFNNKFYDLTKVGRIKINRKLGLAIPEDHLALTKEDLIATIRYLIVLREQGEGEIDDIDHLGNRRVRLVGELLAIQVYAGMLKVERIVKERFRVQDFNKSIVPYDLINSKPLAGIIREFFATGQLSQFLDQTNPLAELAHKRRLSSLGPGGVLKDRATHEVRDVHMSHYGRICPIETPEGQAIGLISSLATFAKVNDLGFIETPYFVHSKDKKENKVIYMDAFKELNVYIAQVEFNDVLRNKSEGDRLQSDIILCRYKGDFIYTNPNNIQYIDVTPTQIFSVATVLIPFLQHDDAVRALMGSNMQRQAVPLIKSQAPIIGTGLEKDIANASQSCLCAQEDGLVEYVAADKIIIRANRNSFDSVEDWLSNGVKIYYLTNFKGSSYNTLIHQFPIVNVGDTVVKGQMLTNASAVKDGELSLGTNLVVAYMPWYGYNYEDAIVLNQRVVSDDLLTSVHIAEYTVDARETRLGPEEITRDIPGVSEPELQYLDEDGIVKIGTRVRAGNILVGKVTLKGDSQNSPEEKLLRAIFGEKSREVRDTSLRVPAGVEGIVIDVKVFSRSGARKDQRYKSVVAEESIRLKREYELYRLTLEKMVKLELCHLLQNAKDFDYKKILASDMVTIEELIAKQKNIDIQKINKIIATYKIQLKVMDGLHKEQLRSLKCGDQLASGVLKMVKVYIATLRTMQVGDKIAGRHGNKGVISLILPREDMPFMEDGTPVDIVLNPLGVPSRMNLGQILEMILGLCGKQLGKQIAENINKNLISKIKEELIKIFGAESIATMEKELGEEGLRRFAEYIGKHGVYFAASVFDGSKFDRDIVPLLNQAGLSQTGSYRLIDGRTGEYFDQKVTVGVMYIIKLNHMVEDKLHARSVGPYSLVTQQPLGGKAQAGGQRFGEMEVWALEAYGCASILQELLTYKSDDITGRHKVHDALVRGDAIPQPGIPESFNVLVKELQALGLCITLSTVDRES